MTWDEELYTSCVCVTRLPGQSLTIRAFIPGNTVGRLGSSYASGKILPKCYYILNVNLNKRRTKWSSGEALDYKPGVYTKEAKKVRRRYDSTSNGHVSTFSINRCWQPPFVISLLLTLLTLYSTTGGFPLSNMNLPEATKVLVPNSFNCSSPVLNRSSTPRA